MLLLYFIDTSDMSTGIERSISELDTLDCISS